MIIQCEEKIAKTLVREAFPQLAAEDDGDASMRVTREYEMALHRALEW